MKKIALLAAVVFSGCNGIDVLTHQPPITPAEWLHMQPYVNVQFLGYNFIITQPSSSVFIYSLAFMAAWAGMFFYKNRSGSNARKWWSIALWLWALSAAAAGTSYQAFSYEIKCAGNEFCTWTSWWEIAYLWFTVASIASMIVAVAYSSFGADKRRYVMWFAAIVFAAYSILLLVGSVLPVQFLISFEFMLLVAGPSVFYLFIQNLIQYRRTKSVLEKRLLITWVWLGLTIVAYFLYLISGITEVLWHKGFWFSENDILHIGLIGWMWYLREKLGKVIE